MGVRREELGEGLRAMPFERYMIYYTQLDETVRIERVLHGSRDPTILIVGNE